jgi:hypothetical protein
MLFFTVAADDRRETARDRLQTVREPVADGARCRAGYLGRLPHIVGAQALDPSRRVPPV